MKDGVVRTVVATALVTALSVSALAFLVGPRLMKASSPMDGMQPALYNGPAQDDNSAQSSATTPTNDAQPQLRRRPSAARSTSSDRTYSSQSSSQSSYSEPVRHNHRSTAKSALIVAGSAGTGAAIGAIAGGGKGAGIGALSGGAAGLIYDRMTANK
jgi:hypothetical protein